MCKVNIKNGDTRIDPCMRRFIKNLNLIITERNKIMACCCGHKKYPMTIVIGLGQLRYDLVSGKYILRARKFYKRDKKGIYYIPETTKHGNRKDKN